MTKHLPIIAASIIGLLFSVILQETAIVVFVFAALGALGGYLATQMPNGSERIYWIFVLATLGLWIASISFLNLSGIWLILPMPITLGYFSARLICRLTGNYHKLPTMK